MSGALPSSGTAGVEFNDLADLLGRSETGTASLPYRPRLTSADPSLAMGLLVGLPVSLGLWALVGLLVRALF